MNKNYYLVFTSFSFFILPAFIIMKCEPTLTVALESPTLPTLPEDAVFSRMIFFCVIFQNESTRRSVVTLYTGEPKIQVHFFDMFG